MKKIILSLSFVCLLFAIKAQELPINEATEKVTFLEVVDADGLNSKELYKVMKEWGIAKGMTLKEEKVEEGEMIFSGKLAVAYERVKGKTEQSNVNYSLTFFAKDDKYRYLFTDFVHEGTSEQMTGGKLELPAPACGPSVSSVSWNTIKKKTLTGMEELVVDLKKKVKAVQNDPARNKDW